MTGKDTVQATFYVQVAPEFYRGYGATDSMASVRGAKVTGFTQKKSQNPKGGTIEVKLTIELPKAVFLPLRPEAIIVVPESMTASHPIEVEALDPNEE